MGTKLDLTNAIEGMSISTQYQSLGITFSPARNVQTDSSLPPYGGKVIFVKAALLHSHGGNSNHPIGGHFGGINPPLESPIRTIGGTFTTPLAKLVLFVSGKTAVEVFDKTGQSVGKNEETTDAKWRQVRLFSETAQINSFESTSTVVGHAIGKIVMYQTMPPTPDFVLSYTGRTVKLKVGIPQQVRFQVLRLHDSIGEIDFSSYSPEPNIVEIVGVDPKEYFGERHETVAVTMIAKVEDVQPGVKRKPVSISGLPTGKNGLAGRVLQVVEIPWLIQESVDARIVGMEITQGIQTYQVPEADDGSGNIRYTQKYWGLPLIKSRKTLVRVFCSVPRNPTYPLPDFLIKLYGWQVQHHDSVVFRASPIQKFDINGSTIETKTIPLGERWRYNRAVDFILPHEWTVYSTGVSLRAELIDFKPFFTYDPDLTNNTFTVTDIEFNERVNLSIQPYQLRILDANGNDVNRAIFPLKDIFGEMTTMHPIGDNQLDVLPWAGYIDITKIYNKGEDKTKTAHNIIEKMRKALKKSGRTVNKYIPIGVFPAWVNASGQRIRGMSRKNDPKVLQVAIVQDAWRPWTTVAHEIGHYLGRNHASSFGGAGNDGQPFDDWPPDQTGLIQGMGWDFWSQSYRFTFENAPGLYTHPQYDYMSYHGESESWMSVRGWQYMAARLSPYYRPQSIVAVSEAQRLKLRDAVSVSAVRHSDGVWKITDVDLVADQFSAVGDKNDAQVRQYRIVALDKSGSILSEALPTISINSKQEEGSKYQALHLEATFEIKDPTEVKVVQILENDIVIAKQSRPQNSPEVKDLKVSLDKHPQTGDVNNWIIQYSAKHAQLELELFATIQYQTADNNWNLVHAGDVVRNSSGQSVINIPNTFFPWNKTGRIRVTVSDGFNTTSVTTENVINAPGFAPTINIISPLEKERHFVTGEYVYLHAATRDDRLGKIADDKILWYLDNDVVAEGELTGFVVPDGIVVGKKKLRAEATDYQGRKVSAVVEVEVTKVNLSSQEILV